MTATGSLVVRTAEHATWIGLDRPAKRNALDVATSHALREAIDAAEDRGPGVLVLHSTTPGMFVAGTDIASIAERDLDDALAPLNVRLFARLAAFRWPTVAVIDGPAYGGGLELALACDLRVATTNARFATPEPGLGILAGAGGNWRLRQLAGLGVARRLLYAGDVLDADAAYRVGLVDRLVEPADAGHPAEELVAAVARRSWRALELTKLALATGQPETTAFDMAAQGVLYGSEDTAARLRAFAQRR